MWRHGSTFIHQPVDVFWSYRVTVSARTAVGLLLSLAGLELSPGQSPGSCACYYGQLQAFVENVFVLSVPVQLAH